MLRVLEWYDGHMNLGLSHGVRKSCLGKVGIWGGDALGEKTGLSAVSVLLSHPAGLCVLSSERRASRGGSCASSQGQFGETKSHLQGCVVTGHFALTLRSSSPPCRASCLLSSSATPATPPRHFIPCQGGKHTLFPSRSLL